MVGSMIGLEGDVKSFGERCFDCSLPTLSSKSLVAPDRIPVLLGFPCSSLRCLKSIDWLPGIVNMPLVQSSVIVLSSAFPHLERLGGERRSMNGSKMLSSSINVAL